MTATEPPLLPTLPMHLMLAMGCWLSSRSAWQCAKNALPSLSSNPGSQQKIEQKLEQALEEEAKSRANSLLSGILRYYETPYRRQVADAPCIWQQGNARLLDYGLRETVGAASPVALFIPSLINKYYILDLEEERSMLRYLAAQGIYPLVLDWGEPGKEEWNFSCADYVTRILIPAMEFILRFSGRPVALAGYCMGGVMALAAARLKAKQTAGIALMAAPWDFHCPEFSPFIMDKTWHEDISRIIKARQSLPAEMIQSLFYLTDPWVFEQKFRRFAELQPESRAARDFIALEHWVNDGVAMTAQVAQDCLIGWAQENRLMKGEWEVAGKKIDPRKMKLPAFIAMPKNDHVVPFHCALPLAQMFPEAETVQPSAGHVGMIVGSKARRELWQPLAEWLHRLP